MQYLKHSYLEGGFQYNICNILYTFYIYIVCIVKNISIPQIKCIKYLQKPTFKQTKLKTKNSKYRNISFIDYQINTPNSIYKTNSYIK